MKSSDRHKKGQEERRKYKRIKKNFLLTYYDKADPSKEYEITQLKNISMGGMCFITNQSFEPSIILAIKLRTPFLSDTTYIEGVVLESHEKVGELLYETRLQFQQLNPQAEFLLAKLIEFFIHNGERNSHA